MPPTVPAVRSFAVFDIVWCFEEDRTSQVTRQFFTRQHEAQIWTNMDDKITDPLRSKYVHINSIYIFEV